MCDLPFLSQAHVHSQRIAFRSGNETTTYGQLLARSTSLAATLLDGTIDLNEQRVALLVSPGFNYSAAQWAIWRSGGIVVPLCLAATVTEWQYALADSESSVVITDLTLSQPMMDFCRQMHIRVMDVNEATITGHTMPKVAISRRAMILYTSGTTNKPKGVVTTHANIQAQIESLVKAWEWDSDDRIPLFLPLHHIHGIINIVGCALWCGATIEPFARFDLNAVLARVGAKAYTLFMAVPTIYVKLIQAIESSNMDARSVILEGFRNMRLMVSGSAALPASVHDHWFQLTGQALLERYGMTEIGMALSNLYRGERRPGAVGAPLPGVEIRLKAENGAIINGENEPGEIQVRGASVFQSYWNRDEATEASFEEGWFRTGDMAVVERGYYRILGRLSIDIIKSGGYKLSALEIESVLLEHPSVNECAVIGVEDATWGEVVAAVVTLKDGEHLDLKSLREWAKQKMSPYKIPQKLHVAKALPRNAMGKVTKPELRQIFHNAEK